MNLRDYWLSTGSVSDWREFANGRNAVLERMLFGLVYLKVDLDYERNRECWGYPSYEAAKAALDAWDGEGEPPDWHRDFQTGRRRENGDPARERIQW